MGFRTATQAVGEVAERTKPGTRARGIAEGPKPARRPDSRSVLKALLPREGPEETFIRMRIEDGTCRLEKVFSMKALGRPNVDFQGRVKPIDPPHSLQMANHLLKGEELPPVVIFRSTSRQFVNGVSQQTVSLVLADGFHRHDAYANLKRDSIPAYVIDVPEAELVTQAMFYATMCNQVRSLPRSDEDRRKVVRMVCALPECQDWTPRQIADHCGMHLDTAKKYQLEYLIENKKDLPPPKARGGAKVATPAPATRKNPAPVVSARSVLPPGAEAEPTPAAVLPPLHNKAQFERWLRERGVLARSPEHGPTAGLYVSTNALIVGDTVAMLCPGTDIDDAYLAMGKVLVLRNVVAPGSSAAVVLNKQAPHRRMYEIGAEIGVVFLTPEELVKAMKV